MGKYMRRKSKTKGEVVSLMEVPSLGGVLTRAKALALQKASAAAAAAVASAGAASYIQLRSRRLVKPTSPKKQKESGVQSNPRANSSRLKVDSVNSSLSVKKLVDEEEEARQKTEIKEAVDLRIDKEEGSFGENMLEVEGRGRTTRETTPCSLIRDPDAIGTPGSSTKPTRSIDGKYELQNTTPRAIPSTSEMDEFFTGSEKQQQQIFIEKYNFDPVSDKPLSGRYEWVKMDATKKS